jgi:hypothetical protein
MEYDICLSHENAGGCFFVCKLLTHVFINSNYKASNERMIGNYKCKRVCKKVVETYSEIFPRKFYGEIKANQDKLRHDSQFPDRYLNWMSQRCKSEAFTT